MGWQAAGVLALILAWAGGAAAGEAPPTTSRDPPSIEDFYATPALSDAVLSPDGRRLAYILHDKDTMTAVVYDLDKGTAATALRTSTKDASIDWIRWKTANRLIAAATYLVLFHARKDDPKSEITGFKYGKFMMAVDPDGRNEVTLFKGDPRTARRSGNVVEMLDTLKDDPDHVLALSPTDRGLPAVWRVDLKTGAADIIERGDETTVGWTTDRTGSVSVRYRASFGALVIEGRSPGETAWTQIVRIRAKDLRKEFSDFDILGPGETPGVFYVAVQPKTADDGDTRTVHLYDLRTRKLGPSLWLALPYDIESIVTSDSTNALRGVCYRVDLLQCDFADPVVQANMRGLSKYFGGRKSLSPLSWSDDGRWWLFAATGPDDPGSYYLYDWTNHQVRSLGPAQPKLPPERLADRRPYAFAARDGTRIPGYLTGPAGAKGPLPLVVIPHGGPMVRDDLDFDALAQLIATRGYLVFQPNFRGSGGFGRKWLEAGYHEWGGLMQDDVHDGVKALIAAGLADPARICAFGASYGGYAALMQGALHPETYKCVISWAGIADLARHVRERKSIDGADGEVHLYDLKQIGDPERDKARLSQQSPLTYAGSYGPPVLLLHGADDDTVSADQSREMDKALRKAGRQTRLILVKDEGHPDWGTDDQTSAVREILTFLQAHIAPAAPPAPLPAENLSRPATPAAPTSR